MFRWRLHGKLVNHPLQTILTLTTTPDPMTYALRVSPRAHRMSIRVKPYIGLEVVIPKRFPRHQIARILQQHQDWITQQLQQQSHTFQPVSLPQSLTLPAIDRHWSIEYITADSNSLTTTTDRLIIQSTDEKKAIERLRKFIRQTAQREFPPRLQALADKLAVRYHKISIRSQKSRWGSCSSKGTISLNDQLLFMPADTLQYLMIHELCHTRHMNHSAAFWKQVEKYCPDYQLHEQRLNHAREQIPQWFSHSLLK